MGACSDANPFLGKAGTPFDGMFGWTGMSWVKPVHGSRYLSTLNKTGKLEGKEQQYGSWMAVSFFDVSVRKLHAVSCWLL